MLKVIRYTITKQSQSSLRLPSFEHFQLHPSLFKYLEANQIHTPTYIQYATLSAIHNNSHRFYHLTAPTGTGKTLAYLLPITSALKQQEDAKGATTVAQRPRALVITASK